MFDKHLPELHLGDHRAWVRRRSLVFDSERNFAKHLGD